MLGSLIIYLKGMRRMMFQLSGFYYNFNTLKLSYMLYLTKMRAAYVINYTRVHFDGQCCGRYYLCMHA